MSTLRRDVCLGDYRLTGALMRLADFILREMEAILLEWDSFASTCSPRAANMSRRALRNHAKQILEAVAQDLRTPQTAEAEVTKSKGQAPAMLGGQETAAQTHAILRARSGFDINQLMAEYRALRASVLRLWMAECQTSTIEVTDLIRFNEAIDQAIAESIEYFDAQLERARNLLLGMLGHDMRTPLSAIKMTAEFLASLDLGAEVSQAAAVVLRSGKVIQALLEDLVDFNRTRLGVGINVSPALIDLAIPFTDELTILRSAHPNRVLELELATDSKGCWDGHRLQQLLRNLVVNALNYGTPDTPVRVVMTGSNSELMIEVINHGLTLEQTTLDQIFEPLKRAPQRAPASNDISLGLGLFIAREIATAHGGQIHATSIDQTTTFTVQLPRYATA